MQLPQQSAGRATEAVKRFLTGQMSIQSKSVRPDAYGSTLVISVAGVPCPAEQDYSRHQNAHELLERLYERAYEASKHVLEQASEAACGRRVRDSALHTNPKCGDCVIFVHFGCQRPGQAKAVPPAGSDAQEHRKET